MLKEILIANLLTSLVANSKSKLIPWEVIWLNILRLFGINYYIITDLVKCKLLQKKIAKNLNKIVDDDCYGVILNWNYIANVKFRDDGKIKVELYCSKSTFDILMENNEKKPEDESSEPAKKPDVKKNELKIYTSVGPYSNIWYSLRKVKLFKHTPTAIQDSFMKTVIDQYKKKDNAVALLYGKPNSGKTMAGLMIAQELKGSYCNTFKPWEAGQSMARLYSFTYPTAENPLVIAFDECDVALMNIHSGNILPNPKVPTEMVDKNGWNTFFDNLNRGIYPHVIVILTTNKTPEFVKQMDASYIREGRVDLIHEFV